MFIKLTNDSLSSTNHLILLTNMSEVLLLGPQCWTMLHHARHVFPRYPAKSGTLAPDFADRSSCSPFHHWCGNDSLKTKNNISNLWKNVTWHFLPNLKEAFFLKGQSFKAAVRKHLCLWWEALGLGFGIKGITIKKMLKARWNPRPIVIEMKLTN